MERQTCCIVGNRLIPRGQADDIAQRLREKIEKLADLGVTRFLTGGGLGFDVLAAQVVLSVREQRPDLRHILILPCRDHSKNWTDDALQTYRDIKSRSDEIIYTSETACRGHILKRNRYMVDNADYCLCYLVKTSGRTAQTVRYAEKTDHPTINIAADSVR